MSCLGDVAAALVDGELGHAARERALRHLASCAGCRAEVAAQRRLKGALGRGPEPAPHSELTARLLAVSSPSARPAGTRPVGGSVVSGLAVGGRASRGPRPVSPGRLVRPGRLGRGRSGRHRVAVGSALALVVGTATVLALGGPPAARPGPAVDPGSDVFVVAFQRSAGDGVVVSNAGVTRSER